MTDSPIRLHFLPATRRLRRRGDISGLPMRRASKEPKQRMFVCLVPMLLVLSVSACATNPPNRAQEPTTMTTAEPPSGTDNPALSAEDVSRRFLKLIESVTSRDDLTRDHVQTMMGLTLKDSPNGPFHSQPLGGGWLYVVSIGHETAPGTSISLSLEFIRKDDRFADMLSICSPDFKAYHDALKAIGYRDVPQYDQINGEVGRLIGVSYVRDGLSIDILPEVMRFPDGKVEPACVRRISLVTTNSDSATATNPLLASRAVGARFLKVIDRLNADPDISLGELSEAMEIPVGQMSPRHNGHSAAIPMGGDWEYTLQWWQATSPGPWASIVLQFDNAELHEYADFSPVCGIALKQYRDAFLARGFNERLDRDDAGRLLAANYTADHLFILLQPGMKNAVDDGPHPVCIRRIELVNRKNGG